VKLNVTFSETGYSGNISVDFSKSDNTFSTDFGQLQVVTDYVDPAERYEGEYTATPKVEAQTLPTAKNISTRISHCWQFLILKPATPAVEIPCI